jgi:ribosomal protein S18 acetylase RimI-like enzyme
MPVVRPTIPEDVPSILALINGVFAEYCCVLNVAEDTHLLAPGPFFRTGGGEFWVVADDGRVLATVAVLLHSDAAELKCLYVHPALRRQGWGRRLCELAMNHARQAGRTAMMLWTDTRFAGAQRLYEGLGFVRCGERELHDSNNTREFGYERMLG